MNLFTKRNFSSTIGLILIAFTGCQRGGPVALKSDADTKVRVKTIAVQQTELKRTTAQPATVHPFYETEIRCKVSGYVSGVNVDIGQYVQTGQVLATLDIPEMQKQRLIIESRVALLEAEVQAATAQTKLADAAVQSAEAKMAQAQSENKGVDALLAAAESELRRTSDLVSRGVVEQRLLDEAIKNRDSEAAAQEALASAVQSATAEVSVAQAEKTTALAKLDTAKAKTDVARSELAELDVMLGYATVKAPFDGVVTRRHVNLGDLIDNRSGSTSVPLFVLSQIDQVRIQIPIPESDAPFVQAGDSVSLNFPAFESEPVIEATVTRTTGNLDLNTRTMLVEVEMKNADRKLLPGMFGEATIDLDTRTAANMLPSRAVRFDESGKAFVYIVADGNKVQVVDVAIGTHTGTQIEILSGISPGQTVIDAHLKRFTDGQIVQPL